MRLLSVIFLFIFNIILQSSLFKHLQIFDIKPDTALVFIVCFSFLRDDVEGALMGLFAGLLRDMLFCSFIGYYALIYALAGFLCGKPFKDYYRENYIFPALLTFLSAFVCEFVTYITHFMLHGKTDTLYYVSKIVLPSAVYTTLCVLPLYWLVYKINLRLEHREENKRYLSTSLTGAVHGK